MQCTEKAELQQRRRKEPQEAKAKEQRRRHRKAKDPVDRPPPDLYAILGVSPLASLAEVKRAAEKERIKTHPDNLSGCNLSH